MSSKNNVNPDYYKVAGRDRPNEDRAPQPPAQEDAPTPRKRRKGRTPATNFIPGAAPVGESPEAENEAGPRGDERKAPRRKAG